MMFDETYESNIVWFEQITELLNQIAIEVNIDHYRIQNTTIAQILEREKEILSSKVFYIFSHF